MLHKDRIINLEKSLKERILVLDGAMGTELLKLGLKLPLPLWSAIANEEHYKKVVEIHKNYIEGGCDVITTNTFRTSYRSYEKAKVKYALTRSNNSFKKAIKASFCLFDINKPSSIFFIKGLTVGEKCPPEL